MYKSQAENILCKVSIQRMKDFISLRDACNYIGLPPDLLRRLSDVQPSPDFKPETERDAVYHLQKIKYYIDHGVNKPIDIDCFCRDGRIYNWPVIIDGRHRYIASLLRGDKFIPAIYSGPVGLKDYLTFQSNNKPSYSGHIL